MTRRRRKPRRLPLPSTWRPAIASPRSPAHAEHWLDRHEREREAQDDVLRVLAERPASSGVGFSR